MFEPGTIVRITATNLEDAKQGTRAQVLTGGAGTVLLRVMLASSKVIAVMSDEVELDPHQSGHHPANQI